MTLIELMVAMAVLSVLVVMLVQVLNNTGSAWTAGQAQTERRGAARVLADSVARDLQTALMPMDTADPTTLQFVLNPAGVPAPYRNSDALFWQTPIATDASRGDVAEVGYFLKWDTTTKPGIACPQFCRFFVNPTDANYLIYKQPSSWLSGTILDAVAPGNNVGGNAYRGLFAENVIGFWARCYVPNTNTTDPTQTGKLILSTGPYDSRVKKALPRSVKISLVIVDSRALPKLKAIPDYSTAGSAGEPDLQNFIANLPNGVRQACQSYSTEIFLQNAQ